MSHREASHPIGDGASLGSNAHLTAQQQQQQILAIQVVGTAAALLSSFSQLPQLNAVRASRNISGLSLGTPSVLIATSILWSIYYVLTGTYHGIISCCFNLFSAVIITFTIVSIRYYDYPGTDETPAL